MKSILEFDVKMLRPGFSLEAQDIANPGVTVLFGHSGAGKTTLLRLIAGLDKPDSGLIKFGNTAFFNDKNQLNLPAEKRKIGYVFQEDRLFPHLTVRENLAYGMAEKDGNSLQESADFMGLSHLLDRQPSTLSGGERQRAAIARALLMRPDMVMMDEPLSALDPARRARLLPYISSLKSRFDGPILYVSHHIDAGLAIADRIIVMEEGKIAASGSVQDVVISTAFRRFAGRSDSGSVLIGKVAREKRALTLAGQTVDMPDIHLKEGSDIALRVLARDIVLALTPLTDTSMSILLPATIESIETCPDSPNEQDVILRLNDNQPLISRITKKSRERLHLTPGMHIFAMVKAVAMVRL